MDIYDDSMWLIHMVENLLSISRIENNVMPLHLSIEVVNDVIDEAIKHISRDLRNHVLVKEPVDTFLMAEMDARLVIQVLINLINNSITHTPDGTTIVIQCRYDSKEVFISVADNGLGISDEDKEHVFEMFYSGNNITGDNQRSTGLGLALCRSIIYAHGGTFQLEDNTPCGSIFTFSLQRKEIKIDE
jgi:two-component system sensor histidine kinase KdpD